MVPFSKRFTEPFVDEHVRDGHEQSDGHNERIVPHDAEESTFGRQQFNGIERKLKVNIGDRFYIQHACRKLLARRYYFSFPVSSRR